MQDDGSPLFRRALIWTTAKAAIAIVTLSVLAAQFLSTSSLDRSSMGRLASDAQRGRDPIYTGSIASAASTKLDPCAVDRRR